MFSILDISGVPSYIIIQSFFIRQWFLTEARCFYFWHSFWAAIVLNLVLFLEALLSLGLWCLSILGLQGCHRLSYMFDYFKQNNTIQICWYNLLLFFFNEQKGRKMGVLREISRSNHQRCSMKKAVSRNFAKFSGKKPVPESLF